MTTTAASRSRHPGHRLCGQARDLPQRRHRSRIFRFEPGEFADAVEAIPNGAAMLTQSGRGTGEVAAQPVISPQRPHQHRHELVRWDRCRASAHLSVRGPPRSVARISRRHDRYLSSSGTSTTGAVRAPCPPAPNRVDHWSRLCAVKAAVRYTGNEDCGRVVAVERSPVSGRCQDTPSGARSGMITEPDASQGLAVAPGRWACCVGRAALSCSRAEPAGGEQPRVFRTGFLLVSCRFLAVQPSVVNFLRCAVSES